MATLSLSNGFQVAASGQTLSIRDCEANPRIAGTSFIPLYLSVNTSHKTLATCSRRRIWLE